MTTDTHTDTDTDIAASGALPELPRSLHGRRILITGAGSGIGRATAKLLGGRGAALALVDRDGDGLAETTRHVTGHPEQVDITDECAVDDAVARAAAALGGLDGIVHAAGIMFRGRAVDVAPSSWRTVLDVNLTGAYTVLRAAVPWLAQQPAATVVTIASAQGLLPNAPGYTAYAASKGGLIALTKAFAAELAPRIRVNTVCPGMVDTAMADGFRSNTTAYALGRLADPTEIARVIGFLTSSESSYITGAALAADGGRSFH